MERFGLMDVQAQAVEDMRLGRLSGLERQKIHDDLAEVQALIQHLNEILGDDHLVVEMIKEDLLRIKDKYGDERRSEIGARCRRNRH